MEKPLVSVVIPTYNRYVYLKGSIEACLSIPTRNFEIIVQDNTPDNTEIIDYLGKIADERVKYFYEPVHISMTENCDLGVMHASGEYVCLLGDDDCVCENILRAASYCKKNDVDACCFPFPGFNWTDMTFDGKSLKDPRYFIREKADGSVRILDSRKELLDSLHSGAGLNSTMPRAYHGMVAKQCLDRIYEKLGTYFPGPSPDMANAIVTCLESKKTIYLSDYLIVSGYGYKSARGEGNRGQHFGKIEEKPWLPKDVMSKWDRNIPKIFSGETIIAQSAVQAMNAWGCNKKEYRYPYSHLYATFFWHHKDIAKTALAFYLQSPWRFGQFVKGCFQRLLIKFRKPEVSYSIKNDEIATLAKAKEYTESISKGLDYLPASI